MYYSIYIKNARRYIHTAVYESWEASWQLYCAGTLSGTQQAVSYIAIFFMFSWK
jgi:hypothetical protein